MINDYDKKVKLINELSKLIGDHGFNRLMLLVKSEDDWDGQNAAQMKYSSLEKMAEFLKDKIIPDAVGYFLDYEGNVLINWILDGSTVDVSFEDKGVSLYMDGLDDGVYLTKFIIKELNLHNPKEAIEPYLNKLELVSRMQDYITDKAFKSLLNTATVKDGWGEHDDEKAVSIESLESLIMLFQEFEREEVLDLYFYPISDGSLEAFWKVDGVSHEIAFTKHGVEFYIYPFDDFLIVDRASFSKYNKLSDFLKGEKNMKKMIASFKNHIVTSKPYKNEYGHKVKAVTLEDHVLYALLRKKADYRKCADNPEKAVKHAKNFVDVLNSFQKVGEQYRAKHPHNLYFKERLGVDLTPEFVVELTSLIEEQINKFN